MISEGAAIAFIYGSCVVGIIWGLFNASAVMGIEVKPGVAGDESLKDKNIAGLIDIGTKISKGANAFLRQEYTVMTMFFLVFSVVVFILVDIYSQNGSGKVFRVYATLSYIIGAVTSIVCGLIGMKIAVNANFRTTYKAITSLADAWCTAFQAGCVMGFCMVSISLAMLLSLFLVYKSVYAPLNFPDNNQPTDNTHTFPLMFDLLAGYGLGGSSMALFGRVGGGIYTKAADVGADLVGKVEENLAEDSPRNPATIADNVGDNVGDIAGMGADLFGSFAESTCAALVLIGGSFELVNGGPAGTNQIITAVYYPMIISAVGIFCSLLSSVIGIYGYRVNEIPMIEKALNLQLLISTFLILVALYFASIMTLPDSWNMQVRGSTRQIKWWYCYVSTAFGLVSGFLIGLSTDYYTSNAHYPVQEMAGICPSGAAINVIYGLALGYLSTIIPIILLSITIIVGTFLLGMLGVALAAIGMLSNLCICLAIDAYGPISDNAGGIAQMCEIGEEVRAKTDALDAAGNTTAAIGKGFAIGSAALVSLALYGAFLTRCAVPTGQYFTQVLVNDGWIFGSMFVGAMLPYFFSALTMKAVGRAANEMVREVRRQFQDPRIRSGELEPDYERCISVSTQASIREMIAPGCLVIFTPIVMGVVFHPKIVAGILPGAILSGVQLAISMSNTGGAWDNAKKYIESGKLVNENGERLGKGSEAHKAAVTGDTIGDPLKDTSGPSLNILVKLMAIISLVFAEGFKQTAWLSNVLQINDNGANT